MELKQAIEANLDAIKTGIKEFYDGDDAGRKNAENSYKKLLDYREKLAREMEQIEAALVEARCIDRTFGTHVKIKYGK